MSLEARFSEVWFHWLWFLRGSNCAYVAVGRVGSIYYYYSVNLLFEWHCYEFVYAIVHWLLFTSMLVIDVLLLIIFPPEWTMQLACSISLSLCNAYEIYIHNYVYYDYQPTYIIASVMLLFLFCISQITNLRKLSCFKNCLPNFCIRIRVYCVNNILWFNACYLYVKYMFKLHFMVWACLFACLLIIRHLRQIVSCLNLLYGLLPW
jgi:hypothetical protein